MTSAYILILAMLVLGGLLATLGDRLGTKVGKARLSLFKLRPRQTATVVTIITGILISSSTLGILFATSKSLRVGIFRLDEKLKELRQAREELTNVTLQKTQVEQALAEAKTEQTQAQQRLDDINKYLLDAIEQQNKTAEKLDRAEKKLSETQTEFQVAKTQLSLIESQYQRAQSQLDTFSEQAQTLRQEIQKLQSERQKLLRQTEEVKVQIAQRDRVIAKRQLEIEQRDAEIAAKQSQVVEKEAQISQQEAQISQQEAQISQQEVQISQREAQISQQEVQISQQRKEITEQQAQIARRQAEIDQRDRVIAERENRLKELERQQAFLTQDIENLENDFQFLREGNVAILRNQVLASGVVRVLKPAGARQAAEELLREANVAAMERIRPGTDANEEKVVQITPIEVERLVNEINDGQAYVVRILSSANYLVGEKDVEVFADAALNKIVFLRGEVLAGTSVSPATMNQEKLRERIDILLASASFRARRAGILAGPIEIAEGRLTLLEFIEQLQQYDREVIIQAIASEATYTAGPLKINLVVIQNGQIIFNN